MERMSDKKLMFDRLFDNRWVPMWNFEGGPQAPGVMKSGTPLWNVWQRLKKMVEDAEE